MRSNPARLLAPWFVALLVIALIISGLWGYLLAGAVLIALAVPLAIFAIAIFRLATGRVEAYPTLARTGRCGNCGYDLTGLAPDAVCPECGGRGDA